MANPAVECQLDDYSLAAGHPIPAGITSADIRAGSDYFLKAADQVNNQS